MPLSEQEQRLLDEMERNLYQNDADFVATVGTRNGRVNYRAIILGILLALVGVGALVAGVILQQPLIGVAGFAIMLVGVLVAINPPKQKGGSPGPVGAGSARASTKAPASSSFMDRLNERWDKRDENRD
ncbi:DUF3040 domain-containing protein [Compostimonas suwonensis]|uniref:DUF3040 family protein n=1 Tax=Compostimonas suwonensis TaxID=1048394 RepID=A0A2M9BAY0_9MICO|nr:DUF3040 domain-containing protein [Compostimonas suwonensis]PJJ55102.1 Protein of unknown function (DUF3040) [Compostimonas suwonensis]